MLVKNPSLEQRYVNILSGVNLTDIDDLVSYKSSDVAYATPGTFLHNDAKWKAAIVWCQDRGIEFKVFTEVTLQKMGIRRVERHC